jgi:hypothetical protein
LGTGKIKPADWILKAPGRMQAPYPSPRQSQLEEVRTVGTHSVAGGEFGPVRIPITTRE